MWRLAGARDSAALHRAAELLLADPVDLGYEGHRARAFALAVEGHVDEALAELNAGWTEEWPFPRTYAADVARVRYLGGDDTHAVAALRLAARGADSADPRVVDLASLVVRRTPRLWRRALRVAAAAGTPSQRAASVAAVTRARFARGGDAQPGIRSTILPS